MARRDVVAPKFRSAGTLSIRVGMRYSTNRVRGLLFARAMLIVNPFMFTSLVVDVVGLPLTNSHNARSAKLTFHIPHAGVLHGFAGYFEAMLYGDVGLSIHPLRKDQISKDMLSWFPLFFPLKVLSRLRPYSKPRD